MLFCRCKRSHILMSKTNTLTHFTQTACIESNFIHETQPLRQHSLRVKLQNGSLHRFQYMQAVLRTPPHEYLAKLIYIIIIINECEFFFFKYRNCIITVKIALLSAILQNVLTVFCANLRNFLQTPSHSFSKMINLCALKSVRHIFYGFNNFTQFD